MDTQAQMTAGVQGSILLALALSELTIEQCITFILLT